LATGRPVGVLVSFSSVVGASLDGLPVVASPASDASVSLASDAVVSIVSDAVTSLESTEVEVVAVVVLVLEEGEVGSELVAELLVGDVLVLG
jgi:hypothetical protein